MCEISIGIDGQTRRVKLEIFGFLRSTQPTWFVGNADLRSLPVNLCHIAHKDCSMAKIEGFRVKNFKVFKEVALGRVWHPQKRQRSLV